MTAVAVSAVNRVTHIAMAAAPLAAVTPVSMESIVGEGRRQRRESESNANKIAERNNFGLAHGVLLRGGADKVHPIGTTLAPSITQRNRSVSRLNGGRAPSERRHLASQSILR